MKPFVVLIFEINCYEFEPLVKIEWGKSYELGRRPKKEQASLWLYVAIEEEDKARVPADLAANCVKLCGPDDWAAAEKTLQAWKASFDRLGIEHFEQTCSDD